MEDVLPVLLDIGLSSRVDEVKALRFVDAILKNLFTILD